MGRVQGNEMLWIGRVCGFLCSTRKLGPGACPRLYLAQQYAPNNVDAPKNVEFGQVFWSTPPPSQF